MLQEGHLLSRHYADGAVVVVGNQVHSPFGDIHLHALETVEAQPRLHDRVQQVVVEGIEFAWLQVADGDGVGLGRLVIHLHVLQIILAGHKAAAVEHH